MFRKLVLLLVMGAFVLSGVFAVSLKTEEVIHPFDSEPMLKSYYGNVSISGDDNYWDATKVSLMTISSGKAVYSWFGHAGFLVDFPDGRQVVYDYGTFSFNADSFVMNFIMGRLWFACYGSYAFYTLEDAAEEGREVSLVELPLTSQQKRDLVGFVALNSSSEYRTYLYHHYKDNCATRLRDIIDYATEGQFRQWAESQSGLSYRKQASRALSRNPLVQWVLEFLQSGNIDKSATLWDEMFLPEILEKSVMEYFGLEKQVVIKGSTTVSPENPQSNLLFSVLLGLIPGLVVGALVYTGKRKSYYVFSGVMDILFGLFGSVLFFMMFFTNHDVTWLNMNILFCNPVLLVLAVLSFIAIRKVGLRRIVSRFYGAFTVSVGLVLILESLFPGFFIQQNKSAIITVLLWYLCNSSVQGKVLEAEARS